LQERPWRKGRKDKRDLPGKGIVWYNVKSYVTFDKKGAGNRTGAVKEGRKHEVQGVSD
jgi:hypothetical protein